jgi:hypothetical protein
MQYPKTGMSPGNAQLKPCALTDCRMSHGHLFKRNLLNKQFSAVNSRGQEYWDQRLPEVERHGVQWRSAWGQAIKMTTLTHIELTLKKSYHLLKFLLLV